MDIFAGKELCIPLSAINKFIAQARESFDGPWLPMHIDHDKYLRDVHAFVNTCANLETDNVDAYEKSISSVIYLLAAIAIDNYGATNAEFNEGFVLSFKSDITMGAGLGSSASYAVCLAGAFYFLTK